MTTNRFSEFIETSESALELYESIDFYLQRGGPTRAQCNRYYIDLCKSRQVKPLSKSTFYTRFKDIDPIEECYIRNGRPAAVKMRRMIMQKYEVAGVFSQYQSDALHVPLVLRNNINLEYSGMPISFNTLDVFTRCVMGSFNDSSNDGETAASVIECYKRAYLPKHYYRQRYGLENDYDQFGIALTDCHDAGPAYTAQATQEFRKNARVIDMVTPPGQPYKNCFIESYNRTVAKMFVSGLPGYLPPKRVAQSEYYKNLEREATLTKLEYDVLYERWKVDIYHQRPHSGLCGGIPALHYREAIEKKLLVPCQLRNLDWIRTAGGVKSQGTIQEHRGIQHDNRLYNSSELQALRRIMVKRDESEKAEVIFYHFPHPENINEIKVIDPRKSGEVMFVPYTRSIQGRNENEEPAILENAFVEDELKKLCTETSEAIIAHAKERNKKIEKERRKRITRAQELLLDPKNMTQDMCEGIATGRTRNKSHFDSLSGITPAASRKAGIHSGRSDDTRKPSGTYSRDDFKGKQL